MATPTPPPLFLFVTTSLARVLFGLPFVGFGLLHFLNAKAMAVAVPVPGAVAWVYITGAGLMAGGLGILTRRLGMWAALGLALLLLTFILAIHLPATIQHGQAALGNLLKDVALLAGALTWAGLLASNEQ